MSIIRLHWRLTFLVLLGIGGIAAIAPTGMSFAAPRARRATKPPVTPQPVKPPAELIKITRLRKVFQTTRFVCYAPSEHDPVRRTLPTQAGIRQDLLTLKPFNGIITYSCDPRQGLDQIVPVAAELKLRVVLGVWNPKSIVELDTAVTQAKKYPNVVAIIVGNESQLSRRVEWEELEAAIRLVQTALPTMSVSTSEPITSFGNEDLRRVVDFHSPICHWIFQGGDKRDYQAAVHWLKDRVEGIQQASYGGKPILLKEHGLPSGPEPFSPELQAQYWEAWFAAQPNSGSVNSAFWEAFDCPWKSQTNGGPLATAEEHWGGWTVKREAKPVVQVLIRQR